MVCWQLQPKGCPWDIPQNVSVIVSLVVTCTESFWYLGSGSPFLVLGLDDLRLTFPSLIMQ